MNFLHKPTRSNSYRDAKILPMWLDDPLAPDPHARLTEKKRYDLAIVGGGYNGLWTALLAKERYPNLEVCILEADRIGWAASGRNGGFCTSTLTHGASNAEERFPNEAAKLEHLGLENLRELAETVERYGIDCNLERTGEIEVATKEHELEWLDELAKSESRFGSNVKVLDAKEVRGEIHSPTYLGGVWKQDTTYMLNPARLAWGLERVIRELGVDIYESTKVLDLSRHGAQLTVKTHYADVSAQKVAICTNAFPPLLKRISNYVVPVYDYVLATEPLSAERMESIGWKNRQGVGDVSNQFHYYRLTMDNRILWGGYDAIYHYGGAVNDSLDQRDRTFEVLANHFYSTFPQLEGVNFSHRWGGAIDTCSRFFPFFGRAFSNMAAYSVGFTGMGVGSTRFASNVLLDMLYEGRTERTELELVKTKPAPFPPEPIRYGVIQLTKWALSREDKTGDRNGWLKTLDRLGLGFDS
ncbi:MAG: FAD-dependent oxidoreductase [Acidimicrobiaceae bacterium]|nr:FAD-dependent oxidoreductase [Acidimicrobiaceae bacterium]